MRRFSPVCRTSAALAACLVCLAVPAAAAPTSSSAPSLAVTPGKVAYGTDEVVLSGVVGNGLAGEEVTILAQPCRFTEMAEIATVRTTAGGRYRFEVQPMLNTSFRVRSDWFTSPAVKVGVYPDVKLTRAAPGRYRIRVSTTNPVFLDGKQVLLQRSVGNRWVTVKKARLQKASAETAITVVSAVTVSARVKGKLRAVLPAAQAGCYLGASSNTVRA